MGRWKRHLDYTSETAIYSLTDFRETNLCLLRPQSVNMLFYVDVIPFHISEVLCFEIRVSLKLSCKLFFMSSVRL